MPTAYHVTTAILNVGDFLEIKKSKQERELVFASTSRAKSILHASEGKDDILQVCGDSDEVFERFEGALEEEFNDKKLYTYQLDDTNFLISPDYFKSERVFAEDKEILHKSEINCALTVIKEYEKNGILKIHSYPNRPRDYQCTCKKLDKDLLIKKLLEICKGDQDFSKLKSYFEIRLPHDHLDEIINLISNAKVKMEVWSILMTMCHPRASDDNWDDLVTLTGPQPAL